MAIVGQEYELTREDMARRLEDQVRRYLGMSMDEFTEAIRSGNLPRHPVVPHLLMLVGDGVEQQG